MNLIFTGCIVPPATTTALASLTMLVKCTAGFNRRNFTLEQLSQPVERYMDNDLWYNVYTYTCICCGSIYPWFEFYFLLLLCMVTYDNEFETKEKAIQSTDKIEPQHIQSI